MPDFGIGEALSALLPTLAEGAAEVAPEVAGGVGEFAGGAGELASLAGEGASPLAITVNALPGAAEGVAGAAGGGFSDLLGGAATALGGIGSALAPTSAAASTLAPGTAPSAGPGVSSSAASDPFNALTNPAPGGGGVGASAFAPTPGVNLGGIAPDATSAAAFDAPLSFADRAQPAVQAGQDGTFSPFETPDSPPGSSVGANTFSAAPGSQSTFPVAGTPTASPNLGNFATAPQAPAASGFDVSGNPIDPATGSSNPQYSGGGTAAQYDPGGATTGIQQGAQTGPTDALGKLGQGATDAFNKNPLGLALGAGGLGLAAANANSQSKAVKSLQQQAQKQSGIADQLSNYALTGTLPPGSQAGVDKAIAQAKANAISNAASQGLPTDPTRNTALASTLAAIDANGPIVAAQIAQQLLSSGASFAGLTDQLYGQLASIDQSQKASMGKAIANFAAALNTNGSRGATIQIGGTSAAA